ncbi:MAG: beta-xylosidase [Planctomycetota bacterium]|nr:beta-xylosidase [Planctomycetota bacterium]
MKRIIRHIALVILACAGMASIPHRAAGQDQTPIAIQIDASKTIARLSPAWRFFGYDECNFTYMKDGRKLLGELGKLGPEQVYIRCHHLLTSGDGTPGMKWGSTGVYTEDAKGNPIYNWTIVDHIFDTYMQEGVKPYAQIGFMPKDLSTRPDLYPTEISLEKRVYEAGGQAYPPKDYGKWGELVYQWVNHCVQRYGKAEVEKWYWEVWNEPNILYWKGKPEEYYKLYDYAVEGVRRALPTARVGGNEAAGSEKALRAFLEHCVHGTNLVTGKTGSSIDFISFHAKGSPKFKDGHVQMGIASQLTRIDRNFATVASFPTLKDKPIVIGESDPDGMAARPVSEAPGLGYRNTSQFPSYTAACFAREYELADKYGVNFEGALTWSFEFEGKPYFAGYRVLASNGVDLPILNVFRMFGKMGGSRLAVSSSANLGLDSAIGKGIRDGQSEVYAIAAMEPKKLSVMVYNYYDDDIPGPAASISLALTHLPTTGDATLTEYRIDQDHSNAYTVWKKMGAPEQPSSDEYAQLKQAGQLALAGDPQTVHIDAGKTSLKLNLPRQAVSLLVLEWK